MKTKLKVGLVLGDSLNPNRRLEILEITEKDSRPSVCTIQSCEKISSYFSTSNFQCEIQTIEKAIDLKTYFIKDAALFPSDFPPTIAQGMAIKQNEKMVELKVQLRERYISKKGCDFVGFKLNEESNLKNCYLIYKNQIYRYGNRKNGCVELYFFNGDFYCTVPFKDVSLLINFGLIHD